MELLHEIAERRSIRKFKPDPVEKDIIARICEAGRLAPSAKNRQAWRFVVVQKKAIREAIKRAAYGQEYIEQAPVVIAACTTNVEYKMPNGQLSYPIDITFAVSFMLLQAVHEGLGTCCVTTYNEQEIREILTVPHGMRVVMLLVLGYPDETPAETQRKQVKKIIAYNHW
ncbi:MAG: nitroreductase family protein [Spirochaetales bacterium]|nr:nitroreductase family protein [Spirochaetales bacterium]